MPPTILMIGAFDVKGAEYGYVKALLEQAGNRTLTMDFGTFDPQCPFTIDIDNRSVAAAGGGDLTALQAKNDRGEAMKVMSAGVEKLTAQLFKDHRFDGVIGLGGSGGTGIITAGMRTLPLGLPKVMVSTVASGDTSFYVGLKDITMVPSVVDVAGINRISEKVFKEAAGAITGMVAMDYRGTGESKSIITASMFGQTTPCVNQCRKELQAEGYEVLVFHGSGTGGRTMESMVEEGYVSAVLDITTTEWADELAGGILSAGPTRLEAPGKAGIPHLIVPGCIDMVNFGPPETVPEKYQGRIFYRSKPTTTLMRTTVEENEELGRVFAEKANQATGPVAFLIPFKGFSVVDSQGGPFWDPEADRAFIDSLKKHLHPSIVVREADLHINDEAFSALAVTMLRELITEHTLRLEEKKHAVC